MFINEAKKQILEAVRVYLARDEFGELVIAKKNQRPIFLVGPPGIGKTDIMEQIARELGINLVPYSMTHHTRQSALGLPYIVKKSFDSKTEGDREVQATLYTMSEIIENIYAKMDETGIREGILFLDEINCVSETLAPAMLQFLQYKEFGGCKVPDGWVIVTAGNPPEYNNSVREFDVVTSDRLKRIDVEPDYRVWKDYAVNHGIHPAIVNFLDAHESYFHTVTNNGGEKRFATARGWYDLSEVIKAYEAQRNSPEVPKDAFIVDDKLICQYIQNRIIAKEFSDFYTLFMKYKQDYKVNEILEGRAPEHIKLRARNAAFDEHHALIVILISAILSRIEAVSMRRAVIKNVFEYFKEYKQRLIAGNDDIVMLIEGSIEKIEDELETSKRAGHLTSDRLHIARSTVSELRKYLTRFRSDSMLPRNGIEALSVIKEVYNPCVVALGNETSKTVEQLNNIFIFCEEALIKPGSEGREMLILVKELTINRTSAMFISDNGCPKYFEYNSKLLISDIDNALMQRANNLADVIESIDTIDSIIDGN